MEQAAIKPEQFEVSGGGDEQRGAQRFTLLIRAAKLVTDTAEFICVIRDVSSTGVSVKLFHAAPESEMMALELQSGERYNIRKVWDKPRQLGFEFADDVDVEKFVSEVGEFPKRGIRLGIEFPITVNSAAQRVMAEVENISQQGARFSCDALFAIAQNLRIECEGMKEVRAKVRWRSQNSYGVVFDDTFSLADFAQLAAQLQQPALLDE